MAKTELKPTPPHLVLLAGKMSYQDLAAICDWSASHVEVAFKLFCEAKRKTVESVTLTDVGAFLSYVVANRRRHYEFPSICTRKHAREKAAAKTPNTSIKKSAKAKSPRRASNPLKNG